MKFRIIALAFAAILCSCANKGSNYKPTADQGATLRDMHNNAADHAAYKNDLQKANDWAVQQAGQ